MDGWHVWRRVTEALARARAGRRGPIKTRWVDVNAGDDVTPDVRGRLVAKEIADKTSLLDLSDKVCRWPMGHPGEPDFHFCGESVNPGFPYCVEHCGRAYQAQLPRGARRPPPPLPFGGPRVR